MTETPDAEIFKIDIIGIGRGFASFLCGMRAISMG
jgi:hypothetical protein